MEKNKINNTLFALEDADKINHLILKNLIFIIVQKMMNGLFNIIVYIKDNILLNYRTECYFYNYIICYFYYNNL